MKNEDIAVDNVAIGQRIREQREKLRFTREEFAEIIELSTFYLGQLERGDRQMSLSALVKISSSLHVPADYLIFGEGNDNRDHIITLLNRCTKRELVIIEEMIKILITHSGNQG